LLSGLPTKTKYGRTAASADSVSTVYCPKILNGKFQK
jgi:hypothetical protein